MNVVDAYAEQVASGLVPAGRYHRLACERHLRDRSREGAPDFPYRFRFELAERFFRFASKLKHYKGEWAGTPIVLQPYQQFRLGSIFGWVHQETGLRRFRTSYNELPRKQGKSLEAGVVVLYGAFFDGEPGAEAYTIATKRDQAKIVFNDAKKLVQSSGLKARIRVRVANLHREDTASKLEPLGADHDSTDGLNPHIVIVDEFHAHKDRGLIDVMETATGARRQPLFFQITTAGDNPVSPCGDQHDYACKILDQTLEDESFFAFIAHADDGDDWLDERTWQKANPNWGVSIKPDDMRSLATKAKGIPAASATFKQKRLNIWVNASSPCLSVDGWRRGQTRGWRPALEVPALKHEPCFVGIDLASKIDLCSVTFAFPPAPGRPRWRWLQQIWTPEETMLDRGRRDRAPYGVWAEQGWLLTTPGVRIDHSQVVDSILAARGYYDITGVGYDEWHADKVVDELRAEFPEDAVVPISQTFRGMSAACLSVQADILAGEIDAGGCPVTAWCVGNVVGQADGKDNLMFVKGKSRGRIDPVISGTIATAFWLRVRHEPEPEHQFFVVGGH